MCQSEFTIYCSQSKHTPSAYSSSEVPTQQQSFPPADKRREEQNEYLPGCLFLVGCRGVVVDAAGEGGGGGTAERVGGGGSRGSH
eukprot:scaffold5861_cov98-Skeletonema_dohrnii-CCMP3373.AAC.2